MNIFVGCSSRDTGIAAYDKVARQIADFIVENKFNFVFGGCKYGQMGTIYSIVSKGKDSNIYINISECYKRDLEELTYTDYQLFNTVNERQDAFLKSSDIMIFLPGGIGTIDELLGAIETKRNNEHNIPIVIINVNHFFDDLLKLFDRIYRENLADSQNSQMYFVANSFEEAKYYLLAHSAIKAP